MGDCTLFGQRCASVASEAASIIKQKMKGSTSAPCTFEHGVMYTTSQVINRVCVCVSVCVCVCVCVCLCVCVCVCVVPLMQMVILFNNHAVMARHPTSARERSQ
jgi:hypothetical protein